MTGASMPVDLSMELINATVQLEQPLGDGTRTVGTGFLINAPAADGSPRIVLVTANHVLERMPGAQMRVGTQPQRCFRIVQSIFGQPIHAIGERERGHGTRLARHVEKLDVHGGLSVESRPGCVLHW